VFVCVACNMEVRFFITFCYSLAVLTWLSFAWRKELSKKMALKWLWMKTRWSWSRGQRLTITRNSLNRRFVSKTTLSQRLTVLVECLFLLTCKRIALYSLLLFRSLCLTVFVYFAAKRYGNIGKMHFSKGFERGDHPNPHEVQCTDIFAAHMFHSVCVETYKHTWLPAYYFF